VLYILSASLSGAGEAGEAFIRRVFERITPFHPVSVLPSPPAMMLARVGPDDGVTFVIGDEPTDEATDFLQRATDAGAVVLPVALSAEKRRPPDAAGTSQSFDVPDALRRAGIPAQQIDWAAREFSRAALARLAPTWFRSRLRVFLSYRRADGEGLTAALDRELSARHEHVFRDLVDIQVGDPAQDVIDERLSGADVLVFIDTPLAGESPWVARELATAMGNGIPIVWVRVGAVEDRIALPVPPGGSPLVEIPDPPSGSVSEYAEQILDTAQDQVREAIRASTSAFAAIRGWAVEHGAEVAALDQRRLIYAVSMPRDATASFPRRARLDIVQLFARSPDADDINELKTWLHDAGYADHPVGCRAFDAAVLVRPSTGAILEVDDWAVVDSGARYIGELGGRRRGETHTRAPVLLLLGAFPNEPASHPAVIAAVSSIARSWLSFGGALTFGSHPTFTPLIAEAARSVGYGGSEGRIRAVRSAYFAMLPAERDFAGSMTIDEVPAAGDLDSSLAVMRRHMIRVGSAEVAAVIGGRTTEGDTHDPGVEEELSLAHEAHIPVVVLASPGGQAAVIAARESCADPPWADLGNGLPDELNRQIADGDDYANVARILWDRFGSARS
jgi:hypothetical protein